jgi:hypothetical protein
MDGMAKIVLSDKAPKDAKHFSLANAEIEVPFETDDPQILGDADVHPFLDVERDPVDVIAGVLANPLDPKDDVLSRANSVANDPDAVRAAAEERAAVVENVTALDASLDQKKVSEIKTGDLTVAETVAADEKAAKAATSKENN